ncbi:MAG: prepilin-type N-terminal cleavage/methylation domain-containing protein [Sulfurospirillum sp.]
MNKIANVKAGFTPAFTMIELIFVIIVIGILSAIAIPKLAASRDDAVLVKGKSQIAAIRSGIAMQKSKRLLEGKVPFVPVTLDKNTSPTSLFHDGDYGNILEYGLPIGSKDGQWARVSQNANKSVYKFHLGGTAVQFDYNASSGIFDCDHAIQNCKDLTQ